MLFTEALVRNRNDSEVEVARIFVTKLMSLQKQSYLSYHEDGFLKDRLMTAIKIPPIKIALRHCFPIAAQQLPNCITDRHSEKPKTERSAYVSDDPERELLQEYESMYTLGQQWRSALRNVKPYGNNGPSTAHLGRLDVQTKTDLGGLALCE